MLKMVFDIKGRLIAQSVTGNFAVGVHKTNRGAKNINGIFVPSGVYLINMKYKNQRSSSYIKVKKRFI